MIFFVDEKQGKTIWDEKISQLVLRCSSLGFYNSPILFYAWTSY